MPAGYALTRLPGAEKAGIAIFVTSLVPPIVLFVPLPKVVAALGLWNSWWVLVVLCPTFTIASCTWFMMGFFILRGDSWAGNVRQLTNVLERSLTGLEGDAFRAADLPAFIKKAGAGSSDLRLREAVGRSEEAAIRAALRDAGGI